MTPATCPLWGYASRREKDDGRLLYLAAAGLES